MKQTNNPQSRCKRCDHPRYQHRDGANVMGGACRSKFRKPKHRLRGKGGFCKCERFVE